MCLDLQKGVLCTHPILQFYNVLCEFKLLSCPYNDRTVPATKFRSKHKLNYVALKLKKLDAHIEWAMHDITSINVITSVGQKIMGFQWKTRIFVVARLFKAIVKHHYDSRRQEGEYYKRSELTAGRFLGHACQIIANN